MECLLVNLSLYVRILLLLFHRFNISFCSTIDFIEGTTEVNCFSVDCRVSLIGDGTICKKGICLKDIQFELFQMPQVPIDYSQLGLVQFDIRTRELREVTMGLTKKCGESLLEIKKVVVGLSRTASCLCDSFKALMMTFLLIIEVKINFSLGFDNTG